MARFAYLRVSTDEQAKSGLGLEAQLAAITAEKPVDAVFTDDGYSGAKADRPALVGAIAALQKGDELVVAKRDRLGRDPLLMMELEKHVGKIGARIISVSGEGTEDDSPSSIMMRRIQDAVNENERLMIGIRTKAALAAKKARGERVGQVPMGFDADADGRLHLNEDEQKALDAIRELHGRGWTLRAICAELEQRGIKTKKGKAKWQPKTVARIAKAA